MRIVDVVDIFVVSVIIYYAVKFIRDRRAAKLLIGIVLLVIIYFLSDLLRMNALNFLMTNIFQVGMIALIIVFQPELRTALEKVGGTSLSSINRIVDVKNMQKTLETIEIISRAAEEFSRNRTGALIVIERTTRLGDIIKTGTLVGAEISVKLLGNLFFNKSPLHDGAVIISGNKIVAAGCILTLSSDTDMLFHVGTRHRAGLGMSENSDAVIIIVSEESGRISLAVDGILTRDYSYSMLKETLAAHLLAKESARAKDKREGRNKKNEQ